MRELHGYLLLFLFLLSVESNQKSSFQEIPKLNEELLSKQKQLEKIESGELGLNKVWINITEMNKQVAKV